MAPFIFLKKCIQAFLDLLSFVENFFIPTKVTISWCKNIQSGIFTSSFYKHISPHAPDPAAPQVEIHGCR
jgi:hypothetical protein